MAQMRPDTALITVRGAARDYGRDVPALIHADLDLHAGQICALLGPSGSGKSTLLRAIAGLERLDGGQIQCGESLWSAPGIHVPPEARQVGLVFQDYALFPHMTALDNVAFGLTGPDKNQRALDELTRAELGDKARAYPHELSGGEQQRVALARALAPKPDIVLLDEPFSGLDRRLRADVRRRTLSVLRASGAAVLFVTHDAEEALETADTLALMQAGQIIQSGPPQHVWFNPVSADAARLVGDINVLPARVDAQTVDMVLGRFNAAGLDDQSAVDVLIRPEGLGVREGDRFLVIDRAYAGASVRLTVEDETGHLWHAMAAHTDAPELRSRVDLELDTRFMRIAPRR